MSKLDVNYNWNGEYKLLKEFEEKRFRVSNLKYPEYFYIFINEDKTLKYAIIDDNFGMPALANTMDTQHSLTLRNNCINVLNHLTYKGFIEKIDCNHSDISASYYSHYVDGEIGDRMACSIQCKNCGKELFKSKGKGIDAAYSFIEENKKKFSTLYDMTCDNLNEKFSIKE